MHIGSCMPYIISCWKICETKRPSGISTGCAVQIQNGPVGFGYLGSWVVYIKHNLITSRSRHPDQIKIKKDGGILCFLYL